MSFNLIKGFSWGVQKIIYKNKSESKNDSFISSY